MRHAVERGGGVRCGRVGEPGQGFLGSTQDGQAVDVR